MLRERQFQHSIREDEREIVRANRDHEGGVEPVQMISGGSSYEREIKPAEFAPSSMFIQLGLPLYFCMIWRG
jgi:hypothetical protein